MMVLSIVLTGCSDNSTTDEKTDTNRNRSANKAMTVVFSTIKNRSTTDEAIQAVQDAINVITEASFNIHVILRCYTEDEYDEMIEEAIEAIELQIEEEAELARLKKEAEKAAREAAKSGETTEAETTTEEESSEDGDETVLNEFGFKETIYPKEKGTQLDIILIRSYEQFMDFQSRGLLVALDEQLSIGSKILKQYIHPSFMSAAQVGGRTFAVPNNHFIGEYQYLLLNKALVDKYYYDPDKINTLLEAKDFLDDVLKYENGVIPVLNEPQPLIEYLTDSQGVVGAYVAKGTKAETPVPYKNLLTEPQFTNHLIMVSEYNSKNAINNSGYIGDGNTYAAAFIKGDYTTPELYEDDYYVNVYKYPTATSENMYSGMYAVSKYAADLQRCMQIVTALTINPEMINLLTYGVKDVHYWFNEATGLIEKLNTDYSMNPAYTGNQFLMERSADMDEHTLLLAANKWELAKAQNLDMVFNPYLGFTLKYETKTKDKEGEETIESLKVGANYTVGQVIEGLERVSKGYIDQLYSFKDEFWTEEVEEPYKVRNSTTGEVEDRVRMITVEKSSLIKDKIADLAKTVTADPYVTAALDAKEANSPLSQYTTWQTAKYPPAAAN